MKENGTPLYYKSRKPCPDTVSTEVSELSTKQHHIGKKYGDEGMQTLKKVKLGTSRAEVTKITIELHECNLNKLYLSTAQFRHFVSRNE
jgi:hypothetical protein